MYDAVVAGWYMSPKQELRRLLVSLFSQSELTQFIGDGPGGEQINNTIAWPSSRDKQAQESIEALEREGSLGAGFFERLDGKCPGRRVDIQRVRALFLDDTPTSADPAGVSEQSSKGDDSPWIVGPPILRDEDFFGRERQKADLLDFLSRRQSVQILGERRMGKTSMLRWVQRHCPLDWPLAWLNAQGLNGRTPRAFVEGILEALEREAGGEPEHVLKELTPLIVLVDEADVLAQKGHGFGDGFLDTCRWLCQEGQLVWVSVSRLDLQGLFRTTGLTSAFLNDARQVRVGTLDEPSARALAYDLGPEALEVTGGWAYGIQWLGDAVGRGGDLQEAIDGLANEAAPVFRGWFDGLEPKDRELLKGGGQAPSAAFRRQVAALRSRGLLHRVEAKPWGLWGEFLRG